MPIDYVKARRTMVASQVRTNDVTDLRIQRALETVPRERFVPPGLKPLAYADREIEYAQGRSLLTPRDFAKLLSAAAPRSGELALEAASGSGYATAVLSHLCEMVVGVEADEALVASAQANLTALGAGNAAVIAGDPVKGAPTQGPYDLIFLAGVIETEPTALLQQLKKGGRLAAILRSDGVCRGVVYARSEDVFSPRAAFDAAARATLPGFAAPRRFTF